VGTGKLLREIGEKVPEGTGWTCETLTWSSNSKKIAQTWGPGMIRIWDVETGKGNDSAIAHFGNISGLIVSADGKSAITLGEDNRVRTWDISTAMEQRRVSLPPTTTFAHLLGSSRALLRFERNSLCVWDIEREKELVKVQRDNERGWGTQFSFSRGGLSLFTSESGSFGSRLTKQYDLKTGREDREVEENWVRKSETQKEELVSLAYAGRGRRVAATIRRLPVTGISIPEESQTIIRLKQSANDSAAVWEISAIKTDFRESLSAVSFTPDDRAVLTFNRGDNPVDRHVIKTWVSLLESMTGKERCRFEIPIDLSSSVPGIYAFSRNGDLVALVTESGTTAVIDIRLGRKLTTLNGDQGTVRSLAFGADTATLFTGGSDGTVLIWDLGDHIRKARHVVKLSPEEEKRLWTELADSDTAKAYRAMGTFVTSPTQAVDILGGHLKPVEKLPAANIDKLIVELDNDDFEKREKASRELRQVGPQGKAALQKSLETSKSVEQCRRVKELLAELNERETKPSQSELRELRAIEVLETIGTPLARSILESLAKGASGIRLTDEAAAALGRLDKK
jgi:WD40 repeat protein